MKKRIVAGITLWYILMGLVVCRPTESIPAPAHQKHKSIVQIKLEKHIGDEYISEEIAKSKYPYLMAAIKLEESGLSGPYIVGDGGDSLGMFQIQPQHWGEFDYRVDKQVAHCQKIIDYLISKNKKSLHSAISRYNGRGVKADKYANRVLSKAREIGGNDWNKIQPAYNNRRGPKA